MTQNSVKKYGKNGNVVLLRSTKIDAKFAWGSGHYIQKEQPQLVVDAIYTAIQLTNPVLRNGGRKCCS